MMQERLNVKQLAELIGKTPRTVWRWVRRGWLPPPIAVHGWPRWDSEAVQKALRKGDPESD